MATTSSSSTPTTPRFDFYQTDTVITLSIFIKSISPNSLSVNITPQSLFVRATSTTTGSEYILNIDPLFSPIDPTSSSYKVFSTKIEVILHKTQPGLRWSQLHSSGSSQNQVVTSSITPTYTQTKKPTRSKWDTFQDTDDTTPAASGADAGEADINKFFQKLYADADEDTKRAMMKSYQESGGTTLSTDWSKVGKQQTQIHPPDGMEAKKWEQ